MEYETLRRECLDSITHRTQVASFGLAAIGALFVGPFLGSPYAGSRGLVLGVLAFGVPSVSVLVLLMWLGEYERMHRAGSYLRWLEHRINARIGDHLLTWESWLHHGDRLFSPYVAVVLLFSLVGLGAPVGGAIAVHASSSEWLLVIPGMVTSFLAGLYATFRVFKPKFRMNPELLSLWYKDHLRTDDLKDEKGIPGPDRQPAVSIADPLTPSPH